MKEQKRPIKKQQRPTDTGLGQGSTPWKSWSLTSPIGVCVCVCVCVCVRVCVRVCVCEYIYARMCMHRERERVRERERDRERERHTHTGGWRIHSGEQTGPTCTRATSSTPTSTGAPSASKSRLFPLAEPSGPQTEGGLRGREVGVNGRLTRGYWMSWGGLGEGLGLAWGGLGRRI